MNLNAQKSYFTERGTSGFLKTSGRFHQPFGAKRQGSISSTFYTQLLRAQIPKAQKDTQLKQLFVLSGSAPVKAECKHIDEIDPSTQSLAQKMTFSFTNSILPNSTSAGN